MIRRMLTLGAAALLLATPLQAQVMPGGAGVGAARFRAMARATFLNELADTMAEWMRLSQVGELRELAGIYMPEAIMLLPDESDVATGPARIGAALSRLHAGGNHASLSLRDFSGDTELGYIFGNYEVRDTAGVVVSRGSHTTIFTRHRRRWMIRMQMFRPDLELPPT